MLEQTKEKLTNQDFPGVHHAYLGLVIMLVGFIALFFVPNWLAIPVTVIGLIIFIDDFIQHLVRKVDPDYTSPLHKFYVKYLYPIQIIRLITDILDDLFGRRRNA